MPGEAAGKAAASTAGIKKLWYKNIRIYSFKTDFLLISELFQVMVWIITFAKAIH